MTKNRVCENCACFRSRTKYEGVCEWHECLVPLNSVCAWYTPDVEQVEIESEKFWRKSGTDDSKPKRRSWVEEEKRLIGGMENEN